MKTISMTADIICLLLSVIVVYGALFEMKNQSRQKKVFAACVSLNGFLILCDLVSWVVEGKVSFEPLNYFVTACTFVFSYFTCLFFLRFFMYYVREKGAKGGKWSNRAFMVFLTYCSVMTVLVLVGCANGSLFTLNGGVYGDGPKYPHYMISIAIVFLYMLGFSARYSKLMGLHDSLAISSYVFFPFAGVVINVFNPVVSINYPLAALSCVIIYIMLQSEQESQYIETELRLHKLVQIDELTGLMNRRAYTDAMAHLEKGRPVGVIFCDLNGLKYTNDHKGHEAGDQLLVEMARVLRAQFRRNETFRISGDEFVVIAEGIHEVQFYSRSREMAAQLAKGYDFPLASLGAVYGTSEDIKSLVDKAEENMRAEKERFYNSFPLYKRV